MFFEEIRIKQGLSYISFCPLRIIYKSKFILMATSLVLITVVLTKVHCILKGRVCSEELTALVRSGFAGKQTGCPHPYSTPYNKLCKTYQVYPFTLSDFILKFERPFDHLGPVVQSVVRLMNLLRVISLTVLVDSIVYILIFFAEKMTFFFFQQNISAYLRITQCKF